MGMTRRFLLALAATAAACAQTVETGTFRLHKFLQPIGQETYETLRKDGHLVTTVNFEFTDRRTKVPLKATIETEENLTPVHFEVKGSTSRMSRIDSEVSVTAVNSRIRENKAERTTDTPKQFFTVSGYSPVSAQMLMLRYWRASGKPSLMNLLPSGKATITPRGTDEFQVNGKTVALERYSVDGIIWGQETLWTDAAGTLVAMVGVDAEFDHFEAIRDGYEPALTGFVSRAAEDSLGRLSEISKAGLKPLAGVTAFTNVRLIDGRGGKPVENATVVIQGDRILEAGLKVKAPKKATIIDGRGKSLLPGLWDMHAHYEQVEWGPIYLAAGVTTARDNGNEFEFITTVRNALRDGKGIGPNLLLAGIVDGTSNMAIGLDRVDTAEQAKAAVEKYHKAGFEQIKIYQSVKPEMVKAIAEEAHRAGMTVTGHIPTNMSTYDAVNAGMDMLSHLYPTLYFNALPKGIKRMPGTMPALNADATEVKELVAFLKQHGTVIDPTMTVYELSWHDAAVPEFEPGIAKVAPELAGPLKNSGVPAAMLKFVQPGFDGGVQLVGLMHQAGIPVVAGTDQTVPGYSIYREMELYVKGGMTPLEALASATSVPARAMRLEKETGTIEKGKRADLILVDGDPSKNISDIRKVSSVIKAGKMYDPAELWKSVGFRP